MSYWPWWAGGIALAIVPLVHWFGLSQMFAVSGRFTRVNDALRAGSASGIGSNVVFFAAIAAGSFLSAWSAGTFHAGAGEGAAFARIFGDGRLTTALVLAGGGLLVGFGTRMAGGCTSGHGLVGTSRLQPGSIVATMAFFGTGIAVSLALSRWAS